MQVFLTQFRRKNQHAKLTNNTFCWCVLNRVDVPNPTRYTKLVKLKNKHGNCVVHKSMFSLWEIDNVPCYWVPLGPLLLIPSWAFAICDQDDEPGSCECKLSPFGPAWILHCRSCSKHVGLPRHSIALQREEQLAQEGINSKGNTIVI